MVDTTAGQAAGATSAVAAAASTVTVDATYATAFGTAIPILIGDATVEGKVLWTNADNGSTVAQTASATATTDVSFAVAFGKPTSDSLKLKRLYANSVLIYDASSGAAIQPDQSYKLRFYSGTETQTADPALTTQYGAYTPAFRGLCYLVIEGYDLAAEQPDGKLPQIVAEIAEQPSGPLPVRTLAAGMYGPYVATLPNNDAGTLTYIGNHGFDVYSMVDGNLVSSMALNVGAFAGAALARSQYQQQQYVLASSDKSHYYAIINYNNTSGDGNGNYAIAYISLDTNTIEGAYTNNEVGGCVSFAVSPPVGKWDAYLMLTPAASAPAKLAGQQGVTFSTIGDLPGAGGFFDLAVSIPVPIYPTGLASYPVGTQGPPIVNQYSGTTDPVTGAPTGGVAQPISYSIAAPANVATGNDPASLVPPVAAGTVVCFCCVDTHANPRVIHRWILGDVSRNTAGLPAGADTTYAIRPTQFGFSRFTDADPDPAVTGGSEPFASAVISYNIGFNGSLSYDPRRYVKNGLFVTPTAAELAQTNLTVKDTKRNVTFTTGTTGVRHSAFTLPSGDAIQALIPGDVNNPVLNVVIFGADGKYRMSTYGNVWTADFYSTDFVCVSFYATAPDESAYGATKPYAFKQVTHAGTPDASEPNSAAVIDLWVPREAVAGEVATIPHDYFGLIAPAYEMPFPADVGGYASLKLNRDDGDTLTYGSNILSLVDGSVETFGGEGFQDAVTGAPVASPLNTASTLDSAYGVVYDTSNKLVLFGANGTQGSTPLASIIMALAEDVGYKADDLNLVGLDGINLVGCVVNKTTGFTALLKALSDVFRFDVYDSNGKINCVKKARNAGIIYDGTVAELDDLVAGTSDSSDGNRIAFERDYAEDLPTTLTLEYIDADNAGTVGTQTAKRTRYPIPVSSSDQTTDLQVPVVMDAQNAIQYAQLALFDLWASALTATFRLPPVGMAYDPGDFVAVTLADGTVVNLKVTKVTLNADYSVNLETSTLLEFDTFGSVVKQASLVPVIAPISKPVPANLYAPDYLIYASDDTDDATIPYRWTSNVPAAIYLNLGAGVYNQVATENVNLYSGTATTALPPCTDAGRNPFQSIDKTTVLRFVRRGAGDVPTASNQADFLAGLSVVFVGAPGRWEMLWFRDVTQYPDGSFGLSYLARGRRGSDVYCNGHRAGDVVWFPPSDFPLFTLPKTASGATIDAKTVPIGGNVAQAVDTAIAAGGPILSWTPHRVTATRTDAGIALAWYRRSRKAFRLFTTPAPLEQGALSFDVVIYKTDGVTIARTYAADTAASALYSNADMATDGFVGNSLRVIVYQLSPVAGRGNGRDVTLTIG